MATIRGTVSERVIRRVAAANDADPLALPPLYDTIDPDALDDLVEGMAAGTVAFSYADCAVTVSDDGSITVETNGADCRGGEPASASD
ncbi:MAG: HalOD1 output domain-containing protein [Halolamina sp.]